MCVSSQVAVIEFARNVLGITDADSTEFNPGTPNPAVVFMPEISTKHMGGTMRLGARRTVLQSVNCLTAKLYQKEQYVDERHRHRWAGGGGGLGGEGAARGGGGSWCCWVCPLSTASVFPRTGLLVFSSLWSQSPCSRIATEEGEARCIVHVVVARTQVHMTWPVEGANKRLAKHITPLPTPVHFCTLHWRRFEVNHKIASPNKPLHTNHVPAHPCTLITPLHSLHTPPHPPDIPHPCTPTNCLQPPATRTAQV
jgi:hypothetical protein